MNFSKSKDIESLVNNKYKVYAHKKDTPNRYETLVQHTELCIKYALKLIDDKGIQNIIENFMKQYLGNISSEAVELFEEMYINTIALHDLGKINPLFQLHKMDNLDIKVRMSNKLLTKCSELGTEHSIISAVLYINEYLYKVMQLRNSQERNQLCQILYINSYIISRHHSALSQFKDYIGGLEHKADIIINILGKDNVNIYTESRTLVPNLIYKAGNIVLKSVSNNDSKRACYLFSYARLLYSLLVASDYYATTEYMNNVAINDFGNMSNINEVYNIYKNTELYKKIRNYEAEQYNASNEKLSEESNINVLRTEMFLDAETELIRNLDKNIFFLEAPTGSGKSNVALNLSFKLMEANPKLKRIINVYPFNTLVEQNIETLKNSFKGNDTIIDKFAVINSLTPIKINKHLKSIKDEYVEEDYEEENVKRYVRALLDRQFLNYPYILTTHVSLFDVMFGGNKQNIFAFQQLAHSVIVLDEIQSYNNALWSRIITFFNAMAEILDMKIIIMSATLPNLNYLLQDKDTVNNISANLIIDREKYFSHPLFKDRVKISYELLDAENIEEDLFEHVLNQVNTWKEPQKILVEFIVKENAYKFYNKFIEYYELEDDTPIIRLMTGDDNALERKAIIGEVTSEEVKQRGMILIATQVIEAGVDIDMNIGYKDISRLDGDEQFLGRINRSCKNKGDSIVYFFNWNDASKIYKNDKRIQDDLILLNPDIREILINKQFSKYYDKVMNRLQADDNSISEKNLQAFYKNEVAILDFTDIAQCMKLIADDDWHISVFISRTIETETETLDGEDLWHQYKDLLQDNNLAYAEKQYRLSVIRSKMNYFIYQISSKSDFNWNDRIGELYFIADGEKYFRGGKLDKEKFKQEGAVLIDI